MQILLAGLLLSIWGLMIFSAPKRKRFGRWTSVGDSSIDGEDNDGGCDGGDFGACGGDSGGDGSGGGD